MKIFTILFSILLLLGCTESDKQKGKTEIDLESIDSIFIKNERYGTDSTGLNKAQIELFVKEWNNAKTVGYYNTFPEFWIYVKLKNDSIRIFRVTANQIKEANEWTYALSDSTLINSFRKPLYSSELPINFYPIDFITYVSSDIKSKKDTSILITHLNGVFEINRIKEEQIEHLVQHLESKVTCACYVNPLSSTLPFDDFAEIGGFAAIYLKAIKENKKVDFGLYSCPKVDKELNAELVKWWNKKKSGSNQIEK